MHTIVWNHRSKRAIKYLLLDTYATGTFIYIYDHSLPLNILYTHRAQINPSQTKQAICGSTSHYYPFMDHHSSTIDIYLYM